LQVDEQGRLVRDQRGPHTISGRDAGMSSVPLLTADGDGTYAGEQADTEV